MNKIIIIIWCPRMRRREILEVASHIDMRFIAGRVSQVPIGWQPIFDLVHMRISAWVPTVFGDTWTYFVSVSPTNARSYVELSCLPFDLLASISPWRLRHASRLIASSAYVDRSCSPRERRTARGNQCRRLREWMIRYMHWRLINKWPITPGDTNMEVSTF